MRSHSELLAEGLSGEDMHLAEGSGMGRNWRQKDPLRGSHEAVQRSMGLVRMLVPHRKLALVFVTSQALKG